MNGTAMLNNSVSITGYIYKYFEYSHEEGGVKLFKSEITTKRMNETLDKLPIMMPEGMLYEAGDLIGQKVKVKGTYRSITTRVNNKHRVGIYIYVDTISMVYENIARESPNSIYLDGRLCSEPVHRKTPSGKEIADLVLLVERKPGETDVARCICWGDNAWRACTYKKGERLRLWGRLQSRDYNKRVGRERIERRTAYEVSAGKIEKVSEKETRYGEERKEQSDERDQKNMDM